MSEWHVTPDYIQEHWTDELLNLMIEKLNERHGEKPSSPKVSDKTLFAQAKNLIEVKHD